MKLIVTRKSLRDFTKQAAVFVQPLMPRKKDLKTLKTPGECWAAINYMPERVGYNSPPTFLGVELYSESSNYYFFCPLYLRTVLRIQRYAEIPFVFNLLKFVVLAKEHKKGGKFIVSGITFEVLP